MKKCSSNNEKGLTLVEVLAALVILGILFVGIMTIFPQMTLFNEKTEAKLDTMNLARQEMAVIVKQDKWEKIIFENPVDPLINIPDYLDDTKMESEINILGYTESIVTPPTGIKRFEKKNEYLYEVDIYLQCEAFLNPVLIGSETPPAGSCEKAEKDKLYKVHLKLYKESPPASGNYQMSSETFSFITYKAIKNPAPVSGGG